MTPKGTNITSKSNQNNNKMTKYPLNVGRNFGRVQILVFTPKLEKHGQGAALCFIHFCDSEIKQSTDTSFDSKPKQKLPGYRPVFHTFFDSEIRQSAYNTYIPPPRASTSDFNRIGGTGRKAFTIAIYIYIYIFIEPHGIFCIRARWDRGLARFQNCSLSGACIFGWTGFRILSILG